MSAKAEAAAHLDDAARIVETWTGLIQQADPKFDRADEVETLKNMAAKWRATADNLREENQ